MPRKARIDAPGALHHVIARGIDRRKVFDDDDDDRDFFIERLGKIVSDTETQCFAWALMPNHFHLQILKTGIIPVSTVMKRLLTGTPCTITGDTNDIGHLFQDRYKSIPCREDSYLFELKRYVYLNPLRGKLVSDIKALGNHPYSGIAYFMGRVTAEWRNTAILGLFGDKVSVVRRRYLEFVKKRIAAGKRQISRVGDWFGALGGWSAVKSLRKAGVFQKGDERILGDGEFVKKMLSQAEETFEGKYRLKARGIPQAAVSPSISRGRRIALENHYEIGNL